MPKRFTATEKWNDPWFRKLPAIDKLFWLYICDNCDNAGVWKIDFEMASFQIGLTKVKVIDQEVLTRINSGKLRVKVFNADKLLLIKDYISFQVGNLTGNLTNLQKSCLTLINQYISLKGLVENDFNLTGTLPVRYGYATGISKGKGKGNKGGMGGFAPPTLKDISEYIKEKGYSVNPQRFYDFFAASGWVDSRGNKVRNWKQKIITWDSLNDKPKKSEETPAYYKPFEKETQERVEMTPVQIAENKARIAALTKKIITKSP